MNSYEIKNHESFDKTPLSIATNENLEIIAVGFSDGIIKTYFLKPNNKIEESMNFQTASPRVFQLNFINNSEVMAVLGEKHFSFF